MSHAPVKEYSRGQYSKHSDREESWPRDARISLKAKVITWQDCYCASISHSCCHEKWGMAVMTRKYCISSRHCYWAAGSDSSTDQHCQNWSEKLFHYRNRRCDLKIVILGYMNWILAIDKSRSCCLGILEDRRNYKHDILGFSTVFKKNIKFKKETTFQSCH